MDGASTSPQCGDLMHVAGGQTYGRVMPAHGLCVRGVEQTVGVPTVIVAEIHLTDAGLVV